MNWDALGAIGELVGAVAVVITLTYLAAQIRQNTMSNRNLTLQTISNQNADWLCLITQSSEVARIFRAGQQDLGNLKDEDLVRYGMLMTQFCRVFDAQCHQYISRSLSDDMWRSSLRSIQFVLRRKGAREWWSSWGYQYTEDFQKTVAELLEEEKVPQA